MGHDVLLGVVIAAQGLKGAVKVKTFTETPEALSRYGALHLKDGRRLAIAELRVTKKNEAVVTFEGIGRRDKAEALKGTELFIARVALPQPGEGEFYHADLVGLLAEDEAGRALGTVAAIYNFGAGDVIELRLKNGDSIHLPFTSESVPRIDLAGGIITLALPKDDETAKKGFVE